MTAPLTPPHHQPPNDPWQKPGAGGGAFGPPVQPYPGEGGGVGGGSGAGGESAADDVSLSTEVVRAGVVLLVVTVLGVGLGLLWMWLAPRVPLISTDNAVFLEDTESEQAVGADATFVLLALAFGAVSAAAVFWFNRRGGIPVVVGLALGALLGSLLAWGVGVWLGPTGDVSARAREVGQGVAFDAPLELGAKGALLAWPLAAMLVHLGLTALFGPRDPEPEWDAAYGGGGGVGWGEPGSGPGSAAGGPGSAYGPGPGGGASG